MATQGTDERGLRRLGGALGFRALGSPDAPRMKSRPAAKMKFLRGYAPGSGHRPSRKFLTQSRQTPDCLCVSASWREMRNLQRHRRNATRSAFSSGANFSSSTRLKNSTVSSSVSSRSSCRYGGESLMPRSGKVLIGPSARGLAAVDHLLVEEPLDLQVVHQVVGVVRRRVAGGALRLAEEELLARAARSRWPWPGSSLPKTFSFGRGREIEQRPETRP